MRHSSGSALGSALQPPDLDEPLVERPRLVARLEHASQGSLTVLVAPSGWGKSIAVAQWATRHPNFVAWLTFEPRQSSAMVATLLTAAVAALGTTPRVRQSTTLTPEFQRALVDDLDRLDRSYLVLEGVDHLDADVRDDLGRLIEAAPRHVHFVVTTRADVLFPATIARLAMHDDVTILRRGELGFDHAETLSVLERDANGTIEPVQVDRALARTDGWPAATRMLAYALRDGADVTPTIAAFNGNDAHLRGYFDAEVLAQLPAPLRTFALETAVPDRVTADLCRALTDRDDSVATLDLLERYGLIEPESRTRDWWRYPPLVRDMLRARLRDSNPASEAHLLHVAAEWHLDRGTPGDLGPAARYAIRTRDWEFVHRLVRRHGRRLHEQAHVNAVLSWIAAVPEPVRRADAAFGALEAAVLTLAGHAARAEQVLRGVQEAHHVSRGREIAFAAIRSVWVEDHLSPQQARDAADHVIDGLRDLPPDDFRAVGDIITSQNIGTIAALTRARADWYLGDVRGVRRNLFRELEEGDTSSLSRMHLFGALALVESWNGVPTIGENFAAQARALANDSLAASHPYLVPTELALAHILLEQQSIDAAAAALDRVDALRQIVTHSTWDTMFALERAWLALVTRAPHDGLDALAQDSSDSRLRPLLDARRRALSARLFLALDDANRAHHELAYAPDTATADVAGVAAQLALMQHDLDAARGVLDAGPSPRAEQDQITSCIWLGAVALADGNRAAAIAAGEEALDLGAAGQHVRIFLDAGPVVRPFLDLVARHDKTGYMASVLMTDGPAPSGDPEGASVLTPRELVVLHQLADRLTYAEISEALFISQNTVKTHAKSIYMKLGASGRRDAIQRAEELGLL
jgi:LuxR family maltose regulon positive regulatory protein